MKEKTTQRNFRARARPGRAPREEPPFVTAYMLWFCMAQSNEEEPSAHPGRSVSIERHDARDVDLELADHLAPGQEPDDAAAAVKAAVKEAAEGKAAGAFEFEVPDLVDTPGSLQMISTLWILFLQKLSLQWHVGVEWPSWFLNFLDVLGFLCFKIPALGIEVALLEIPEDCVFVARLLLPVALLARMWWMMMTTSGSDGGGPEMGAPHYGSFAWVVGTVALVVAFGARHLDWRVEWRELADGAGRCALLADHRLSCARTRGACSNLEVVPQQVRALSDHVHMTLTARVTVKCAVARTRYGDERITGEQLHLDRRPGDSGKKAVQNYWKEAAQTELLVLIFLYFSAYLTGVGALLERLDAFCSCPAAGVALKIVYGILLVFYALVPVAGCACLVFFGTESHVYEGKENGCPKEQTEEQYAAWLEEQSKRDYGPFFTAIAPFEKKYAWCA